MTLVILDKECLLSTCEWCGGIIETIEPIALVVPAINGSVTAIEADLIMKTEKGFIVYTPKFTL